MIIARRLNEVHAQKHKTLQKVRYFVWEKQNSFFTKIAWKKLRAA